MAYQGPDGRWYPGHPSGYAAQHGQNQNMSGQTPGRSNRATASGSGLDPLLDFINQQTSANQQFYQGQIGQALRGINAQFTPQRSAVLQALESRGLGRSSEVGRSLGALAGQESMRGQEAISDIGAQQFAARQQMINMYLNYMFQKRLQKDGGGGVWGLLEGIGSAIPYFGGGGSGGGSSGGSSYGSGYSGSPGSGYSTGTGGSGPGGNPNYPIGQYP